jgi:hypothetical protein
LPWAEEEVEEVSLAAGVDLMDRSLEFLPCFPANVAPASDDLVEQPAARDKMGLQGEPVVAPDHDIEVVVMARGLSQEEVERPAARDEPGALEAVKLERNGLHRLELRFVNMPSKGRPL